MKRIIFSLLIAFAFYGNAFAQTVGSNSGAGSVTPSGTFTPGDVIVGGPGATQVQGGSLAINVKGYGAKVDTLLESGGSTTSSSATFAQSAVTFTASDVGKTIVVNGAGVGGAPLITTISAQGGATATLNNVATYTTSSSSSYLTTVRIATAQSGGGSYIPGQTVTMTGGTCALEPQVLVNHTKVVSATVAAGGSGGTNSTSAVVVGTTGTGMKFRALVTVSGAAITAINSIEVAGDYTANPTDITQEPVTGAGLTGAKLVLNMGILEASISQPGNCTAFPASPVSQGATSGSGTGATFTLSSVGAGTWYYGTDDTAAIQAGITALQQNGSFQNGACLLFPAGIALTTTTITTAAYDVCMRGFSKNASWVLMADSTGTADLFTQTAGGRAVIDNLTFNNLGLKTAGSLLHFTDTNNVTITNSGIGASFDWDGLLFDCSTTNPNRIYVYTNYIHSMQNDGVRAECDNALFAVSDFYVEQRNYFTGIGYAAIHMVGAVNGTFITGNTVFSNGYGIYGNAAGVVANQSSDTIANNDLDTDKILSAYFNGLNASIFQSNHAFSGGGVFCENCTNVSGQGSIYVSLTSSFALLLDSVVGWADASSLYSNGSTTGSVGVQGTAAASTDIFITGAVQETGSIPFITFIGPTNPTARVTIQSQINASGSCVSLVSTTYVVSPVIQCPGFFGFGVGAAITTGDLVSILQSANAGRGMTLQNNNTNSGASTYFNIGNNTSGQEVVMTLNGGSNSGGNGTNSFTVQAKGGLFLTGGSTLGFKVDASGHLFAPGQANTPTGKQPLCVDTSTFQLYYGSGGAC